MKEPPWLSWARDILAIAQIGSTYTKDPYDLERYRALSEIGHRILASQALISMDEVADLLKHEKGYPTPKVEVRAAVFRSNGDILMVRERADNDRWTLPGGWADVNLAPSEAIKHEVADEAGYEVEVEKLAAVWDRRRQGYTAGLFPCYAMFFICRPLRCSHNSSIETSEVAWFARDRIPDDLSTGRIRQHQIARVFEHYHDKELPTEFD